MKPKWPTLCGRLSNPITDELTALLQLQKTNVLNPFALRRLTKLLKDEKHE
jgi:hypothetical protein